MNITNLEIIVWIPVGAMLLGMLLWGLIIWVANKHPVVSTFTKKHSVFGYGCLAMTILTLVYLIFKSITSPIMRPVDEVAPRVERPLVEEVVELPTNLENKTLQAKPKDVINSQPETPLVDKAVKYVQEK
ncbi:MAG: hypothetical protein ACRCUJ_12895 [Phocaeicola sp.]